MFIPKRYFYLFQNIDMSHLFFSLLNASKSVSICICVFGTLYLSIFLFTSSTLYKYILMPPSPCDQFTASSSKKFTKYKLKVTQAFQLPKITESKNKYPYSTIFQLVISFKYEPFKMKAQTHNHTLSK